MLLKPRFTFLIFNSSNGKLKFILAYSPTTRLKYVHFWVRKKDTRHILFINIYLYLYEVSDVRTEANSKITCCILEETAKVSL
jgi:hypothetical protein